MHMNSASASLPWSSLHCSQKEEKKKGGGGGGAGVMEGGILVHLIVAFKPQV